MRDIKSTMVLFATLLLLLFSAQGFGQVIPEPVPPPPTVRAAFQLDPFYEQWIDVGGMPVLASAKVSSYAVKEAAWLILQMIGHRRELLNAMGQNMERFSVIAYNEMITQIPEYSYLRPNFYWDRRNRGLGSAPANLTTSCGEENLLNYPGDPYADFINVLIHEFAHTIHLSGMAQVDPGFDERLRRTYEAAMADGLWQGTYAATERKEYWAEGTAAWFNPKQSGSFNNFGNTRQALKAYDPRLAALLAEVYGDSAWRYTPPATRTHLPHLQGFDPQESPTFEWPPELEELYAQLQDPDSDGGGEWVNLPWYVPSELASLNKPRNIGGDTEFLLVNFTGIDVSLYHVALDGTETFYARQRDDIRFFPTYVNQLWLLKDENGNNRGVFIAEEKTGRILVIDIDQPPLVFNPDDIPDQTFTVGYPITPLVLPQVTGGTPPYTYTVTPLPEGMSFDAEARSLIGTPTHLGTTAATYTAKDATSRTASLRFTIDIIQPPLAFTDDDIPDQRFTVGYPITPLVLPQVTGGTAPYTYTLSPIPSGLTFDVGTRQLTGTPTTAMNATDTTYTATDAAGASAALNFTIEVIEDGYGSLDVSGDGQVTVIDLAIVALFYGTQVPVGVSLPADVNADGIVNLLDLTAVAQGIDAAGDDLNQLSLWEVEAGLLTAVEQAAEIEAIAGAPMGSSTLQHALSTGVTYNNVATALADARHLATSNRHLGKVLTALSEFLELLAEMREIPDTTALLPNYPNPFNPETWIPYHLAQAANVTLTIYDIRGKVVRALTLGHQPAGVYESRGRAAYWDGRNQIGEPVASGVYFYTLSTESTRDSVTTGNFNATRKLLIAK